MKLIDEIIENLSSDKPNLTNAMLKTKVLLHKLGKRELVEWVNNEINGYDEKAEAPPYRAVNAQVLANFANMAYQYNRHPIPLSHLDDDYRRTLEGTTLRQSLGVLEEFASNDAGYIQSPIPVEANHILGKGLASGYHIQKTWCEIGTNQITQILIEVRSRLLDFILELSQDLSEDLTDEQVKDIGKRLDANSMFANAMFGDNTTILVGNHNQQTVTNQVKQNDFDSLRELLKKHNVEEADISNLESSLQADQNSKEITKKEFGPSVKLWLKSMLSKAVDTSWKIEIGIASGLLVEALKKFYGW